MPETKLRLNLFHVRRGEQPEAVETYYVLDRKSTGMVARVVIKEDLDLRKHDTLIFDFTHEETT